MSLNQTLLDFLQNHAFLKLNRDAHFVVAYSGGRDSTALLHALHQLLPQQGQSITVTAAYYWHPWRPLQKDIQVIHQNCTQLHINWVMLTPNLTLPHTEAAARDDRYQQLAQLAHDLNATAVLSAHHQDDQVETILFRLCRGTGIDGLTGMPAIRPLTAANSHSGQAAGIALARPFLDLDRKAIDAYIQAHKLHFVDDPTNAELRFKRNMIRHQVLPQLETAFPDVKQALMHLAELAQGDVTIIDTKIESVWQDVYLPANNALDERRFNQLARPFQRRTVRRYLQLLDEAAGLKRVENVIDFICGKDRNAQAPALFSLSSNRFLWIYRGRVTAIRIRKTLIEPLTFSAPIEVSHTQLRATLTITPLSPEQRMAPINYAALSPMEAYVDLKAYGDKTLTLRSRRQGDTIKPLGMKESVRLKRYLINRAVPRFQRDQLPLLTADSQVLWAIGVGLSEDIRVVDRPTHLIKMEPGAQS